MSYLRFLKINYMYVGGVLACKCRYRGLKSSEGGVTNSYEPSHMAAGNTDPLQKQQTFLTTEPFHQLR